jgi:predicted helicase
MKPYPDHPKARYFVKIGLFDELKSFQQLNQRIFDLGPEMKQNYRNAYRGAAFEVFVEALLTVVHRNRFTEVLPKKRWFDLRNELSIPKRDKGIDFICDRPRDGQEPYSTVQAKWRQDPNHTLTYGKDDTSKFYGLGDLAKLHEKLIVTNCPRVTPDLRLQPKATFMLRHELDRLKPADFQQIEAWLKGRKPEPNKAEPRPYQIKAVNRLAQEFKERNKASCIMFCGTGKTLVALWLLKAMDSKLTLVLVPTLALLDQFQNDWRSELEFNAIFVCSDETVGKDGDFKVDDLPFEVTSDIHRIRRFMDSSCRRKIIFSTYQSSQKIQKAVENTGHRFELGIFDEAHKTTGRAKPERNYSIALKDKRIPIIKRAFFTATPRRYKVRKGEVTNEEFFSMDKVKDYGCPVVTYNYKLARDDKWVTPFEIYVSVISEADIDQELADRPALHAELIKQGVTNIHGDEIRSAQVADQITEGPHGFCRSCAAG